MRKVKRIIVVLVLISLASCEFLTGQLTDADKKAIKDQIEDMEDALNSSNYNAFLDCFHDDCDYQGGGVFDSSAFSAVTADNPYSFHDYKYEENDFEITLEVTSAKVKCDTGYGNLVTVYGSSSIEMKKDGSKWKIWKWKLDGNEIFRNIYTP